MGIFKLNGIDYMGGGGQSFQPVIYSTEEREIGVWTDGKPLYQKTLVLEQSFSTNTWYSIDSGTGNELKTVVYAAFVHTNGTTFTIPYFRSSNEYTTGDITGSVFEGLFKGINNVVKMIATVQYTKTADAAGSGTWTPQGVPAVHYSTNEHVVGTWINGKTIYEQTIVGNAISSTGVNVLWERTDIDTVVEYNCIFLDDGNLEYNANYYYSTGAYFRVFVDTQSVWTNTKGIVCQRSNNQPINGTRLTVRYTKTT